MAAGHDRRASKSSTPFMRRDGGDNGSYGSRETPRADPSYEQQICYRHLMPDVSSQELLSRYDDPRASSGSQANRPIILSLGQSSSCRIPRSLSC